MRVNKLLSNMGYCSRKEANRLIEQGRLTINGELCKIGQWTWENEEILLDGKPLVQQELVYLMLNKPVGITCTAERTVQENIIDFINFDHYVFPVGRLDKESQGLILLTNDGHLANQILDAEHYHEKVYVVTVDKPVTEDFLEGMAKGVVIDGKTTRPCKLKPLEDKVFEITLSQGWNRQIRKMCRVFDYRVLKLERVSIMSLKLEDLPLGTFRHLTLNELEVLKQQLENPKDTD